MASNEFSTEYLMEYTGHSTPINAIMWNPFHPSVFLSCASEYNVNVWHKAGKVQFYEQKTLVFNQEIHFYSASNRYFLPKGSFPTTNDVWLGITGGYLSPMFLIQCYYKGWSSKFINCSPLNWKRNTHWRMLES